MSNTGGTPAAHEIVFITGGSSGIGAGLARAWHARGAKVIIAGRDAATLAQVADTCPGMETYVLDVSQPAAVTQCAADLAVRHPGLNVVVNNAGIQRMVNFSADALVLPAEIDPEVDINLKGLLYVTAAFVPILRRQPKARLIQISSGLGFVPLVQSPIYSATKAAVHSFTVSLREQLRGSTIQVIEVIPPLVATNLHRGQSRPVRGAMPLDTFITKTMRALDSGKGELPIGLGAMLQIGARIAPGRFLRIVNRRP